VWKHIFSLSILLLFGISVLAQQTEGPAETAPSAAYKIPPEAVKQTNPVKPAPPSLAQGKKMYGYDCAMCHGNEGDGKGDLVSSMNLKLSDFREPASLKDTTDGELFYIIKNGKGQMPPEGDRAKPDEVWNMINYIRSFARKEAPPKEKPQNR
jgi:mono/diheme cytochrome c family protein